MFKYVENKRKENVLRDENNINDVSNVFLAKKVMIIKFLLKDISRAIGFFTV